jgi:hypothetical protein
VADVGEIHIGEGDGDGGGEFVTVGLFSQSGGINSADEWRIVRTGDGDAHLLAGLTTLTVIDSDRKDFAGGLIFS